MTKNISAVRRAENRVRPRSVRTSTSTAETPSTSAEKDSAEVEEEAASKWKLYASAEADERSAWVPGLSTAFKILVSLRMSAGIWSPVSDCDEVFNYWEPLHFLLYGSGFQTWEYSPLYAIRSYAYLLLHAAPVRLFQIVLPHTKVTTFFYLRCFLGFLCAGVETYLYKVVCRRLGNGIGRLYILFTAMSAGMFIASTAFLPASFSMILNGLALGLWLENRRFLAVLATAVSALAGWPFAAILGLPVVASFLQKGRWKLFAIYSVTSGVLVSGALILVDSYFYGKFVLAPLNILLYNVFSESGANLYGTEPLSFYIINALLNWNIVFPLALMCAPATAFVFHLTSEGRGESRETVWSRFWPVAYINLALYLWLAVFFRQDHKEERFLFPVYPLIALCGALSLDALEKIARRFLHATSLRWLPSYAVSMSVLVFLALAGARSLSVYRNFHAPFDAYMGLGERLSRLPAPSTNPPSPLTVCVGKEWHRFPSSFFLPSHSGLIGGQPSHYPGTWGPDLRARLGNRSEVRMAFVPSEFRGLLPGRFPTHLPLPEATRLVPDDQNEMNLEEPTHYARLADCDFLVDLDVPGPGSPREPPYSRLPAFWSVVHSEPFLVAGLSQPLARAFFVPFLSHRFTTLAPYNVLQNASSTHLPPVPAA